MNGFMISFDAHANSLFHRLSAITKFILLLLWIGVTIVSFDLVVLGVMFVLSIVAFKVARVRFRDVRYIFYFMFSFLVINTLLVFLFSPTEGVDLYGSRTVLFSLTEHYTMTVEQLRYQVVMNLKYLVMVPIAIVFLTTTEPSAFAYALNRLGVPARFAYSVSLALRYIPDVLNDFQTIRLSQQTRGIELGGSIGLVARVKGNSKILLPLILTSLERIDRISVSLTLRGFGNAKGRSWYAAQPMRRTDWVWVVVGVLLFVMSMGVAFWDGSRL
ncbi:MAG: energy-coupling factor transporter transmembrane component T family protein [Bacilli bacterium]